MRVRWSGLGSYWRCWFSEHRLSLTREWGTIQFLEPVFDRSPSLGVILAKEGAPNPASLGLANGVVLMAMCVARIASPAIANSVFAASVNTNILGGHLWVVLLAGIACLGSLSSARIVKESDAAMNRRAGGPD